MTTEQAPVLLRFEPNAQGCTVRFILRYKTETGLRRDRRTNDLIPTRYIKNIRAYLSGELVYNMDFFQPIADNSSFSFLLSDCSEGNPFHLEWMDNDKVTQQLETQISWSITPKSKSTLK